MKSFAFLLLVKLVNSITVLDFDTFVLVLESGESVDETKAWSVELIGFSVVDFELANSVEVLCSLLLVRSIDSVIVFDSSNVEIKIFGLTVDDSVSTGLVNLMVFVSGCVGLVESLSSSLFAKSVDVITGQGRDWDTVVLGFSGFVELLEISETVFELDNSIEELASSLLVV